MVLRIGTSGYSYKEWKGGFYPADRLIGSAIKRGTPNMQATREWTGFHATPVPVNADSAV